MCWQPRVGKNRFCGVVTAFNSGVVMYATGQFEMLAGDFSKGVVNFVGNEVRISAGLHGEMRMANEISSIAIATEETIKKTGGTIGWGLAGAAVLGPVGLLAGLVVGGKKTEVTFIMVFDDGKKLLGRCEKSTFNELMKLTF